MYSYILVLYMSNFDMSNVSQTSLFIFTISSKTDFEEFFLVILQINPNVLLLESLKPPQFHLFMVLAYILKPQPLISLSG